MIRLWKKCRRKISGRWRPFCTQCGKQLFRVINQSEGYYSSINGKFEEVRLYLIVVCSTYVKRKNSGGFYHKSYHIEKIVVRGKLGERVARIINPSPPGDVCRLSKQ